MKRRKRTSRNLASPALDHHGTGSWRCREGPRERRGTGRAGYAGEELRLVPDMASGGEAAGRVGASYLRGGGGEEGEEEERNPRARLEVL